MSEQPPKIFPIHLDDAEAYDLVMSHASREWHENTSGRFDNGARYTFSAKLEENGDVHLRVTYSADNGFCKSAGPLFSKTVRPFSKGKIEMLKRDAMFEIASKEFYKRRAEEERAAILKVQEELFGGGAS